ncbi:MAG: hypothetical protein P1V97_17860, partial [Planctomycetota bacterium]|nr:hypothetical protein [Planctomycetota bacterium]
IIYRPRFLRFDFATPYIGFGPSVVFANGFNNVDPSNEIGVGGNILAGFDYKLSRDVSLKFDIRWRIWNGRLLKGRQAGEPVKENLSTSEKIRMSFEPTFGLVIHFD